MPDDGLWDADGARLQSHLKRYQDIRGRTLSQGLPHAILGLVVARYYPDEEGNTNGSVTEYDVFLVRHQVTLHNLVVKMPFQGVGGGQQITLTPAGVPDTSDPNTIWTNFLDSDGDLVTVSYIDGKWPVIDGCMNHLRTSGGADWHGDSTDGAVYATTYNTTRARINSDGDVEIDLDSNDRSLVINIDGTQVIKITQNGSGDTQIELGTGTLEKSILGETYLAGWAAKVQSHTHEVIGVTAGPADIVSAPSLELTDGMPADHLTEKVKIEK